MREPLEDCLRCARAMGFKQGLDFFQVFAEHAALSAFENNGERLFDLTGYADITEAAYDQMQPARWPPKGRPFSDLRFSTANGRARFVASSASQKIPTNSDFPLLLNTGRLRDQWHTMSRTGLAVVLNQHAPERGWIFIRRTRVASSDQLVEVLGSTGAAYYLAKLTETVSASIAYSLDPG